MPSNVYTNGATVYVSEERDAIQELVDAGVGAQQVSGPPKWIDLQLMDPNTWPPAPHATARAVIRADQVDAIATLPDPA